MHLGDSGFGNRALYTMYTNWRREGTSLRPCTGTDAAWGPQKSFGPNGAAWVPLVGTFTVYLPSFKGSTSESRLKEIRSCLAFPVNTDTTKTNRIHKRNVSNRGGEAGVRDP